jgi:hypothetical protein
MSTIDNMKPLEIAALPLADGRKLALPLLALAEVQQLRPNGKDLGTLAWRGHQLTISSLDVFCGLEAPPVDAHSTVGIFRTGKAETEPFRALAFCGLAAHRCVKPEDMTSIELPQEGHFCAAAELDGEIYLVPDLPGLLYPPVTAATP